MKISITLLILFIFLFNGIEPRPKTVRRNSYVKSSNRSYDSDSDSDSDSDDSDSDSDDDDYWSNCPQIKKINGCNGISTSCKDGKLFINGKEIKNVKPTDTIELISNKLKVNGKFIRRIPPSSNDYSNNNKFGITIGNVVSRNGTKRKETKEKRCPSVNRMFCVSVSTSCIKGQLYINGEKVENVKSTDKVVIYANKLWINDKYIRYVKPEN